MTPILHSFCDPNYVFLTKPLLGHSHTCLPVPSIKTRRSFGPGRRLSRVNVSKSQTAERGKARAAAFPRGIKRSPIMRTFVILFEKSRLSSDNLIYGSRHCPGTKAYLSKFLGSRYHLHLPARFPPVHCIIHRPGQNKHDRSIS